MSLFAKKYPVPNLCTIVVFLPFVFEKFLPALRMPLNSVRREHERHTFPNPFCRRAPANIGDRTIIARVIVELRKLLIRVAMM